MNPLSEEEISICGSVLLNIGSHNGGCLVGVMVGVKTTPTHPTSPVNKGTPSVFRPFLVGVDEKFLKIYLRIPV